MLGSWWEFPQERGGGGWGGRENVRIIFLTFRYILGVNICETHKRRKTIYTEKPVRSQQTRAKEYHLYFLHPFLLCVIQQFRKTSQVFSSRMTPHILTHESWWDQTYHRPFSTSKICRNISEHLILHNGSLIKFFSGNSFVRPNVSAVLLVESKRLAFDAFIFAQIHTINHTTTAISFCNSTNDAEVMFWLKTSSIVVVFANHFLTTTNETVGLLAGLLGVKIRK